MKAGLVSIQFDPCLWTSWNLQAAHAYHVGDLLAVGIRLTIEQLLAELSTVLVTVANEVTNKHSRYFSLT